MRASLWVWPAERPRTESVKELDVRRLLVRRTLQLPTRALEHAHDHGFGIGRGLGLEQNKEDPMNYRTVSADSHVVEPPDLWTERIDPEYLDRAPRVTRGEKRTKPICIPPNLLY